LITAYRLLAPITSQTRDILQNKTNLLQQDSVISELIS